MHKRMRRGKEMYPSFDTRRVLCKQHRPYCVKPLRARLKPSNASNAGSILSGQRTEKASPGRLRSIVLCPVLTKTQDESQSMSAWGAMCRPALGLMLQQCWPEGQKALSANGGKGTGLKQPLHHHLYGCHWKSALRGRKRMPLCGSKRSGLRQTGQLAGQNIQNTGGHWLWPLTTTTMNKTKKGQGVTQEKRGTSTGEAFCGYKAAESLLKNIEVNTQNDANSAIANGGKKTPKHRGGQGKSRLKKEGKTLCLGRWTTSENGSERCLRASGLHP